MVSMYLNMEALSDVYGWSPDQIDRQNPGIMDIYVAILSGKSKANKNKMSGTRKLKKEMKGLR